MVQRSLVQMQMCEMQAVVAGGRRARALRLRRLAQQPQRQQLARPWGQQHHINKDTDTLRTDKVRTNCIPTKSTWTPRKY